MTAMIVKKQAWFTKRDFSWTLCKSNSPENWL